MSVPPPDRPTRPARTSQHCALVVMNCLVIACESESTDATDKQIAGVIRARIARFAERQGAWWDMQ